MVVEEICTITAEGQTIIPKTVREVLGVSPGARIAFRIEEGIVPVHPADQSNEDPALAPFLELLTRDLANRPEAIVAFSPALVDRIERLTEGVSFDPDAPIEGEIA